MEVRRDNYAEQKDWNGKGRWLKNSRVVRKIKITIFRFNFQHSMKTYSWFFMEQTEDMDA